MLNAPNAAAKNDAGMSYQDYEDSQRGDAELRRGVLARLVRILGAQTEERRRLFDVGAGTGDFVVQAEKAGFEATGNDYSPRAIAYCKDRYGIDLSIEPLSAQPPKSFDVVTMWCVLAHVDNPTAFLRDAYSMLRPGGVLFLRTPRRCGIDRVGRIVDVATRGRLDQVSDRRVNLNHRHQYSDASIGYQLARGGLTDVRIEPLAHYPFKTSAYASGTGGPLARLGAVAAPAFDRMIDRGWFFRNAMLVYARR